MYASASVHYCTSVSAKAQKISEKTMCLTLEVQTDGDGRAPGEFELTLFGLPNEVVEWLVAAIQGPRVDLAPPSPSDDEVVA